jgi:hypothetical protein
LLIKPIVNNIEKGSACSGKIHLFPNKKGGQYTPEWHNLNICGPYLLLKFDLQMFPDGGGEVYKNLDKVTVNIFG